MKLASETSLSIHHRVLELQIQWAIRQKEKTESCIEPIDQINTGLPPGVHLFFVFRRVHITTLPRLVPIAFLRLLHPLCKPIFPFLYMYSSSNFKQLFSGLSSQELRDLWEGVNFSNPVQEGESVEIDGLIEGLISPFLYGREKLLL